MRYLGRLHGRGVLTQADRDIVRAAYDIDGFAIHPRGITGSGELRLPSADLALVFGRRDIRLRTDDGRLLDLRFSDKTLRNDADVAHVDVAGDLPTTWHDTPVAEMPRRGTSGANPVPASERTRAAGK